MKTFLYVVSLILTVSAINGCESRQPVYDKSPKQLSAFEPKKFKGDKIYRLSPEDSEIRIFVYRAGILARLGHNHIISTQTIDGAIYQDSELDHSGIIMRLPVASFIVDKDTLRQAAGKEFESVPGPKDIKATRLNMLGEHILNADQHPDIMLTSINISGPADKPTAHMRITIRNTASDFMIPIEVAYNTGSIRIKGKTRIRQSVFGLEPFSILMGAIAVQDALDIEFEIVGRLSSL